MMQGNELCTILHVYNDNEIIIKVEQQEQRLTRQRKQRYTLPQLPDDAVWRMQQ